MVCSLCMGQNMVSMSNGLRVPCPCCANQVAPIVPKLDPVKVDSYLHQCSISDNLTDVEPMVKPKPVVETKTGMSSEMRLSRSEKMKRSWMERKAKAAAEAAAK